MDAELMTLRDVARHLRLNEKTVSRLAQDGELPAQKLPRGWRFSRTAIEAWRASRRPAKRIPTQPLPAEATGMPAPLTIAGVMDVSRIKLKLLGHAKDAVLRELVELVIDPLNCRQTDLFFQALKARVDLCPTCVNEGVAIPHARNALIGLVDQPLVAYGRHPAGIEFGALDGQPVRHFFLLCAPTVREHLQLLARLARVVREPKFREQLLAAATPHDVLARVRTAEAGIPTS
jgi:excisionase family DNA binding protein